MEINSLFDKGSLLWEIDINTNPVAQGRPKFNRFTGRAYDPKKSSDAKLLIKSLISESAPDVLFSEPLSVVIGSYILPPKMNKKLTALAQEEMLAPLHKPDVDIYFKGICDACKGIVWTDDSLITDIYSYKRYTYKPHIYLAVYKSKVEGR